MLWALTFRPDPLRGTLERSQPSRHHGRDVLSLLGGFLQQARERVPVQGQHLDLVVPRAHGRHPRPTLEETDLTEVVARLQPGEVDVVSARLVVHDLHPSAAHHVEPVCRLALADDHLAGRIPHQLHPGQQTRQLERIQAWEGRRQAIREDSPPQDPSNLVRSEVGLRYQLHEGIALKGERDDACDRPHGGRPANTVEQADLTEVVAATSRATRWLARPGSVRSTSTSPSAMT